MAHISNETTIAEPVLVCPYNPSHQILRSRMQYHLVKCQKNHPSTEKAICPFNATHRIPRPEMQYHIATCPERRIVEEHKYVTQDESVNAIDGSKPAGLVPYKTPTVPPNEENWDEFEGNGYDPASLSVKKPILRNLPGATKSERKKFRLMERRRVQMLNSGSVVESVHINDSNTGENIRHKKWDSSMAQALRLGMGRGAIVSDSRQ